MIISRPRPIGFYAPNYTYDKRMCAIRLCFSVSTHRIGCRLFFTARYCYFFHRFLFFIITQTRRSSCQLRFALSLLQRSGSSREASRFSFPTAFEKVAPHSRRLLVGTCPKFAVAQLLRPFLFALLPQPPADGSVKRRQCLDCVKVPVTRTA